MWNILWASRRFVALVNGLILSVVSLIVGALVAWLTPRVPWVGSEAAAEWIRYLSYAGAGLLFMVFTAWSTGTAIEDAGAKAAPHPAGILPVTAPDLTPPIKRPTIAGTVLRSVWHIVTSPLRRKPQ